MKIQFLKCLTYDIYSYLCGKFLPMNIDVFDVAKYIIQQVGPMSTMKLQKLVYYCQAWSLVWDEQPLFKEPIQAWANGPVVPELYSYHRGHFTVEPEEFKIGNASKLSDEQKDTIDTVLLSYADKTAKWLIDLTHMEDPWLIAREGLQPNDRSNQVITWESMAEYYSSI
ncbi:hypothetical protein D3C87_158640 [compost metagenome]